MNFESTKAPTQIVYIGTRQSTKVFPPKPIAIASKLIILSFTTIYFFCAIISKSIGANTSLGRGNYKLRMKILGLGF